MLFLIQIHVYIVSLVYVNRACFEGSMNNVNVSYTKLVYRQHWMVAWRIRYCPLQLWHHDNKARFLLSGRVGSTLKIYVELYS